MSSKETKKPKKKVEPPAPQYFDDRGNPCDFEKWMGNLKKKYVFFCKANNESPPIPQVMLKFRSSLEEEKEFTTLGLSGLDINGSHILPLVQFMQAYGKIQRLAFWNTNLGNDGITTLSSFLPGNTVLKYLTISDSNVTELGYGALFHALPYSSITTLSFEHSTMNAAILSRLGVAIEKCASLARQQANAAIEESLAMYLAEQEKLKAEAETKKGKKGKKGKGKKGKGKKGKKGKGMLVHERPINEVFNEFFTLRELNLAYCGIDPLLAPSLSILVEKACKHIPTLILKGNPFGAFGLGEIGAGLCRAAIDLSQDEVALTVLTNLPPTNGDPVVALPPAPSEPELPIPQPEDQVEEAPTSKPPSAGGPAIEPYVPLEPIGCASVQLKVLDLSGCSIHEALPDSYAGFGDGVIACANISTIHLKDNLFTDTELQWMSPGLLLQRNLIVCTLPVTLSKERVTEHYLVFKEHKRILDEDTKRRKGKKGKKGKKGSKSKK